jgi:hypothetical protein
VRRGGEPVGAVAQAEFDAGEQLAVGGIDQVLGHLAEGLLGGGPQLVHQGADAGLAVFWGR